MTMFTRNDKAPDTSSTQPQPKVETPVSVTAPAMEPKRPVASSQPSVSQMVPSAAIGGTQGVSLISKALKITGQLESTEDIQIEGEIDGDVRGVTVRVGSGAKVKGTVYGEEVELSGTVEGRIEARKVVLTSSGHMSGDVVHQDITIQSGAFIDGHCKPDFGKADTKKVVPVIKATVQ